MNDMIFSGIQWDKGNRTKCQKHGVTIAEIEHIFQNDPGIAPDLAHSHTETRFFALGKTREGRSIFIVFTVRETEIRPISARYMHEKEVSRYEKEAPNP
jgi:uncharacterized DUF497 family protein